MSIDAVSDISNKEAAAASQQPYHPLVQGSFDCQCFERTPEQEARLLKLSAMLSELRDEIFKLLQEVKKHPKNLALWLEIAELKSKHKVLNNEFAAEQKDPTRVMPQSIKDSLSLLDAAVKPAMSSAQSLQNQDMTDIHLREANAVKSKDFNNCNHASSVSSSETQSSAGTAQSL